MSLETVLQIGKALRNSDNNLKYFKYVEPCPKDMDDNRLISLTIPVKEDFSFDWENIRRTEENQIDSLYYLKFKTSDSDSLVKYIFGDIYYEKNASLKKDGSVDFREGGYYRLANPTHSNAAFRQSSFFRGKPDYFDLIQKSNGPKTCIQRFHEELDKSIDRIENILNYVHAIINWIETRSPFNLTDIIDNKDELYRRSVSRIFGLLSNATLKKAGLSTELSECNLTQQRKVFDLDSSSVFIHFEFQGNNHWYKFQEDFELLLAKILSEFVESISDGIVLKKTLYKTLCSGDKKNDIQFPGFLDSNKCKSKMFHSDSLKDLFYAIDYSSKGKSITGTDIKLIVLPKGDHLCAKDYDNFLDKRDEARINAVNHDNYEELSDSIFDFIDNDNNLITSFDLVFCKKGGMSSPDTDLVELSGIEKSSLKLIQERLQRISHEVGNARKQFLMTGKLLYPITVNNSFRDLIGNPQTDLKTGKVTFKANSKYKSHLLRVLPLIYTGNYHRDEALLPSFIQNVEFTVRAGDSKYSFLKFELMFLYKIQNTKIDRFMEITTSESYQIGFMLGGLAKNLSLEINSFEKNYVGNLTRRIGNLTDFIKLKNEIEQKLILHDKTKYTFQISYDLTQKVKVFKTRYDKEECVFGFMESYFKPITKRETAKDGLTQTVEE